MAGRVRGEPELGQRRPRVRRALGIAGSLLLVATGWSGSAQSDPPAADSSGELQYRFDELGLVLTLPPWLQPSMAATTGDLTLVATFEEADREPGAAIRLSVERLGAMLERGALDRSHPGPAGKLLELRWRGQHLVALVEPAEADPDRTRLTIPVPLTPEAVALVFEAPTARYPELTALAATVLFSLSGTPGWLPEKRPLRPSAMRAVALMALALLVVVLVIALAPDLKRSRRRRRG